MRPKVHVVQSLKFSWLYPKRRRRCSLNIPRDRQTRRRRHALARANRGLVGILAAGFFCLGLGDEPFVDEYAYITQSYQPDLVFAGRTNDRAWLERVAFDLVPLPKYLINLSFRAAGIPRPSRSVGDGLVPRHPY